MCECVDSYDTHLEHPEDPYAAGMLYASRALILLRFVVAACFGCCILLLPTPMQTPMMPLSSSRRILMLRVCSYDFSLV
jgi:hypothetical protein